MCFGYDGEAALQQARERQGMSRRSLLRGAAGVAAGAGLVGAGAAPATGKAVTRPWKRVPPGKISIQLYTVRDALGGQPGFEATMEAIAADGYPRVEMAGYYGRTAAQIREYFEDLGIRASSSHDGISGSEAAMHAKFENANTLGQRYVVVPYLNSDKLSDWQTWAEQMNAEAAVARTYGLRYGYHNHAHEFTIDLGGGLTPWEVLTSRLDPRLVHLEVDLYWAYTGGVNTNAADPDRFAIEVIHEAPQRVRQFHVKDRDASTGDMCDLGTGVVDFPRIFRTHKAEEYIVENDTPDVSPLTSAAVGKLYLEHTNF